MSEQIFVGLTSDKFHIYRCICIEVAKYVINVPQMELCIVKRFFFDLRKINEHD